MATQLHNVNLEARDSADQFSDDSGYDEGYLSTESVASSIFQYEEENGRTYHAFRRGKYVMPNDEGEQERMDITYHCVRLTMEGLHYISPIADPRMILDIGTGTGIWAIDMADDYPHAQVIGTDLSPIQPTAVPPNLEFQIADVDETWTFNQQFDFVHTRLMNGFSIKSWHHFYEQAFKVMQPGGWVENQESDLNFGSDDNTFPENSAVKRWEALWEQGINNFGLTGRCYPEQIKSAMEGAGFINVAIRPYKIPVGPFCKDKRLREAGLLMLVSLLEGLSGLSLRTFTQGLGWSVAELEVLLMEVRKEWKQKRVHSYCPLYVIYGQKPPTAT